MGAIWNPMGGVSSMAGARVRDFAVIFLPLAALLTAALVTYDQVGLRNERSLLETAERLRVEAGRTGIGRDLDSVISDILILANSENTRRLAEGDLEARAALTADFATFLRERGIYAQIRYLDAAGLEVVRVDRRNGTGVVIPEDRLQNKAERYYVRLALEQDRGGVFVSRLDLNVERGTIERPFRPTIRFATPILDRAGERKGIIVLNYLAANLFQHIREDLAGAAGEIMLVNGDGEWLLTPDPADAWGFQLGHGRAFAGAYPRAWRRLAGADSGAFMDADGLFTFTTFDPVAALATRHSREGLGTARATAPEQWVSSWKLVTRTAPGAWTARWQPNRRAAIWLYIVLLAVNGLASGYIARARVMRRRAVETVRDYSRKLEGEVEDRTKELEKALDLGLKTAQALAEREQSLKAILVNMADGLVTIDENGAIQTYNHAAEQIFGYTEAEVRGRNVQILMPEPYRSEHDDYLRHYRHSGNSKAIGLRREVEGMRKDGSLFPLDLSLAEFHVNGERRFIGIVRDATERKEAERRLRLAKEHADEASRAKSEFLASMSHELRTPLNAIIGFSETMVGEIFGPMPNARYKEYAGDILASGRHLLDLIVDILDLSKIEAGKLELTEAQIDLADLIQDCSRLIEQRATSKEIELAVSLPEGLPTLRGDERRLRQILLNLLSNAVKFTPAQGRISTSAWLAEDGALVLEISDTGVGIAAEDIATALDPFGQVGSANDGHNEGTGLGLPLTKELVRLHDGTLDIASEVGIGTTVTIRFPNTRLARRAA